MHLPYIGGWTPSSAVPFPSLGAPRAFHQKLSVRKATVGEPEFQFQHLLALRLGVDHLPATEGLPSVWPIRPSSTLRYTGLTDTQRA